MYVNVLTAKCQLSRLMKIAIKGENVIIAGKRISAVKWALIICMTMSIDPA